MCSLVLSTICLGIRYKIERVNKEKKYITIWEEINRSRMEITLFRLSLLEAFFENVAPEQLASVAFFPGGGGGGFK